MTPSVHHWDKLLLGVNDNITASDSLIHAVVINDNLIVVHFVPNLDAEGVWVSITCPNPDEHKLSQESKQLVRQAGEAQLATKFPPANRWLFIGIPTAIGLAIVAGAFWLVGIIC